MNQVLFICVLGTLLGLLLGAPLNLYQIISWHWAILLFFILLAFVVFLQPRKIQQPALIKSLFLLSGFLVGFGWATAFLYYNLGWSLAEGLWRVPSEILLEVSEVTQHYETASRIEGCVVRAPKSWNIPTYKKCPVKARWYWYAPRQPTDQLGSEQKVWQPEERANPVPGELWQLEVRARPVSGLLNDGGYDQKKHLIRHQIQLTGSAQQLVRIEQATFSVNSVRTYIYRSFQNYLDKLPTYLQEGFGVLLALALAERHWMSQETWENLQHTGLAHLMAISGLHLGLVFMGTLYLLKGVGSFLSFLFSHTLRRAPQRQTSQAISPPKLKNKNIMYLLLAMSLAYLYAALAGFSVATLRAFILVVLYCLNQIFQWRLSSGRFILYTVTGVLLLDPLSSLDAGFWLSVGAVCAICIWHWRRDHQNSSTLWRFEWMLFFSLAPLSLLFFSGLPLLAPLTNLIVIPIFTFVILPVLLISLVCLILPGGWYEPLWFILATGMSYLLEGVSFLAAWPSVWPGFWLESVNPWVMLLFIAYLIAWVWPAKRLARIAAGAVSIYLLLPILKPEKPADFAIHFLDVGQGTAIIIQRETKAFIYDTGPTYLSGTDIANRALIPFLKYHNLQVTMLVLSHPHQDHQGGAQTLLKEYPSLTLLESHLTPQYKTTAEKYPQLFTDSSMTKAGIVRAAPIPCKMGQHWLWEGVQVRVLAPMPGPSLGANNDSCVLKLSYKNKHFLLPGDSEWENEYRLVARYASNLESDLLAVPHHGSRSSSQTRFIRAVQPKIAVANRGFANQFKMPSPEVLDRYQAEQILFLDTAELGQVSIILQENGQWQIRNKRKIIHSLKRSTKLES